jgi:para-nitrobenzyl esterase
MLVAVLAFTTGCGGVTANSGIIQLQSGPVRGKVEVGVRVFPGIPYAAPPVGDLRRQPPQEVASWTDVKKARILAPPARSQNSRQEANTARIACI